MGKSSIFWFVITVGISLALTMLLLMLGYPIFILFAFLPLVWSFKKDSTDEYIKPIKMIKYCPRCGYSLEGWENYCPRCGFKLR